MQIFDCARACPAFRWKNNGGEEYLVLYTCEIRRKTSACKKNIYRVSENYEIITLYMCIENARCKRVVNESRGFAEKAASFFSSLSDCSIHHGANKNSSLLSIKNSIRKIYTRIERAKFALSRRANNAHYCIKTRINRERGDMKERERGL